MHLLHFAFLWLLAELEYWVLRDEMASNPGVGEGESHQPELPGLILQSATEVDERAWSVQDSRRRRAEAWPPFGDESQETLAP
jgi:hypothetical protein